MARVLYSRYQSEINGSQHKVGPTLREKGLLFVGLDVIGDYLTEINVTSPTCMREIDRAENTQIAKKVIAAIEVALVEHRRS